MRRRLPLAGGGRSTRALEWSGASGDDRRRRPRRATPPAGPPRSTRAATAGRRRGFAAPQPTVAATNAARAKARSELGVRKSPYERQRNRTTLGSPAPTHRAVRKSSPRRQRNHAIPERPLAPEGGPSRSRSAGRCARGTGPRTLVTAGSDDLAHSGRATRAGSCVAPARSTTPASERRLGGVRAALSRRRGLTGSTPPL
jgi:hypothetical protein